jgi:fumarate reductase flavoprotein subunit
MSSRSEPYIPLVVVGAGAAGMMTSLYAASLGIESILLEKSVRKGTNAELSGGLLQAAGTRYQQEHGVNDDPELMMADIMQKNHGRANAEVVLEICKHSKEFVHFIADYVGLPLHLDMSVRWAGHSAYRMHTNSRETGRELVSAMRRAVRRDSRITFLDNAPVAGLIEARDGVAGVVTSGTGDDDRLYAGSVVLATSGFAANRDMISTYCPEALSATFIGAETSSGEGIRWGLDLGAAVEHMTAWQGHAHVNPKYGTHLSGALPYVGSIIVNVDGRRFAREDKGYSEFTVDLLAQRGGEAVEIFDQAILDRLATNGILSEAMEAGAVRRFETLHDLAAACHLPVATLEAEVTAYNAAAAGSVADSVGREQFGAPLSSPFYASVITGGLAHTQGGLAIDKFCRVRRVDGSYIQGLYATGGTAAGMSGDGVDGYTSGNGLAHALSTGIMAAEHVASRVVGTAGTAIRAV